MGAAAPLEGAARPSKSKADQKKLAEHQLGLALGSHLQSLAAMLYLMGWQKGDATSALSMAWPESARD